LKSFYKLSYSNNKNKMDPTRVAPLTIDVTDECLNRTVNSVVTGATVIKNSLESETDMSRGKKVLKWIGTLVIGPLSFLTCCCCCACCGSMRGPGAMVKYDEDYDSLPSDAKKMVHVTDYCMMAGVSARALPLCCCCCCGCFGTIGTMQGAAALGALDSAKKRL
jgi:hypothetical protein